MIEAPGVRVAVWRPRGIDFYPADQIDGTCRLRLLVHDLRALNYIPQGGI